MNLNVYGVTARLVPATGGKNISAPVGTSYAPIYSGIAVFTDLAIQD
jgi:hypothetical protein